MLNSHHELHYNDHNQLSYEYIVISQAAFIKINRIKKNAFAGEHMANGSSPGGRVGVGIEPLRTVEREIMQHFFL